MKGLALSNKNRDLKYYYCPKCLAAYENKDDYGDDDDPQCGVKQCFNLNFSDKIYNIARKNLKSNYGFNKNNRDILSDTLPYLYNNIKITIHIDTIKKMVALTRLSQNFITKILKDYLLINPDKRKDNKSSIFYKTEIEKDYLYNLVKENEISMFTLRRVLLNKKSLYRYYEKKLNYEKVKKLIIKSNKIRKLEHLEAITDRVVFYMSILEEVVYHTTNFYFKLSGEEQASNQENFNFQLNKEDQEEEQLNIDIFTAYSLGFTEALVKDLFKVEKLSKDRLVYIREYAKLFQTIQFVNNQPYEYTNGKYYYNKVDNRKKQKIVDLKELHIGLIIDYVIALHSPDVLNSIYITDEDNAIKYDKIHNSKLIEFKLPKILLKKIYTSLEYSSKDEIKNIKYKGKAYKSRMEFYKSLKMFNYSSYLSIEIELMQYIKKEFYSK